MRTGRDLDSVVPATWLIRDSRGLRPPSGVAVRLAASARALGSWMMGRWRAVTLEHLWWALIFLLALAFVLALFSRERAIAP